MNKRRVVGWLAVGAGVGFVLGLARSAQAGAPTPQIFQVEDTGNHQAAQTIHVSAFPDVQATVKLNCPPIPNYTGDLEDAPVSVWENTPLATRQAIAKCVRARDQAYSDYVASHFLGGSNPIKASISWDFGDPSGAYNQVKGFNAAHIYNNPGTYTVKLTVQNEFGASGVATLKTTVLPDQRAAYYIDAVAGNDANDGRTQVTPWKTLNRALALPIGGKHVMLKRGGALYSLPAGKIFHLGSNDWIHAYGVGIAPVVQGQGGSLFAFDPHGTHMMVAGLKLDSAPGTSGQVANVFGKNVVFRNNTLGRINTAWVVNGFAFGTQTQGVLLQGNGNPPVKGVWNPDFSSSYFLFNGGKQVTSYGNWIKIKAPFGQPVIRTCGKVQDFAIVDNHVFGDVTNKHDPISIRNGRNIYMGKSVIYSGAANTGARCSPNSGPNEAVNNVLFEDNFFEDAYAQVEQSNLNIGLYRNFFHIHNPTIADMTLYDGMTIDGSNDGEDMSPTLGVVVDHNTLIHEYDYGRMASFYTTDPKSIEFTNNSVYAPLWGNTYYHAIPFQTHSPATLSMGIFKKLGGNHYYLTTPVKAMVNFGDGVKDLSYWNMFASPADSITEIKTVTIPNPDQGVPK